MDTHTPTVDVATAAARLGITPEAVYKRIRRGQLQATRLDGRWFVDLDGSTNRNGQADKPAEPLDGPRSDGSSSSSSELVAVLEAEVADLRQANAELRKLLALALQRPLLEAPTDLASVDAKCQPRPWWRRWLVWP